MESGDKKGDENNVCKHRQNYRPPWHSSKNELKVKALMSEEDYAVEVLGGLHKNTDGACFRPKLIKDLFKTETLKLASLPVSDAYKMYIAIDPAPGGDSQTASAMGIVSGVLIMNGTFVILGMDNVNVGKNVDMFYKHIEQHLERLAAMWGERCPRTVLKTIIEANSSVFTAAHISERIKNWNNMANLTNRNAFAFVTDTTYTSDHGTTSIGVYTGKKDANKGYMAQMTRIYLSHKQYLFADSMISHSEIKDIKSVLEKQLKEYIKEKENPKQVERSHDVDKVHYRYHGRNNDDLVMAFQLFSIFSLADDQGLELEN
jgi:hypothetical protein